MKQLLATQSLKIPKTVTISVKSRVVKIEGPRGALTKSFKHLNLDIYLTGTIVKGKKNQSLKVDLWLGSKVEAAAIRTVCSHVKNMITGVTRGFEYRMRFVYAHFPINANIVASGKELEVRNYLGEKMVRHVPMLEGVTVGRSERQKDEIFVTGNNIESVSQSAASIQASTAIFNKDIRKFLDGIYVSEKIVLEEAKPAAAKGKGK